MAEPPHEEMDSLVDELIKDASNITNIPYVLFGHSLGSRVAFELVCILSSIDMPLPSHFIASGSRAPHLRCEKECIYELPQNEFIQEIEKLKGTPKEIISSPELMKLFEPLLRADFKMADNYQAKATKIHCPISVLHGKDDSEITSEQLEAWSELSDANFEIIHLPGDHFFINTHASMVIRHVNEIVLSTLKLLTAPIPKTIIL